jgi:hypothetical protein
MKSVRVNGIDVIDSGLEVKAGENIDGIELEFTNQLNGLSGSVTNARGQAATDYTAVVFSQDRERWLGQTRYFRLTRGDLNGQFKIAGLPAGDYYAIAVDSVDPNEAQDPEFLDKASIRATKFSLGDIEQRVLDLKLTTGL